MTAIRTRIAPSPTGNLHLGTARTALFNYLFARKNNGVFVLRIEDTDIERSDKKYEKDIIDGLKWLGIKWDEGVEKDGDCAHYRQSERIVIYSQYIQKLLDGGKAFYCWHTKEELEKEKKEQMAKKELLRHSCVYKSRTNRKTHKTADAIIRLNTPEKKVIFNDLIRGGVEFNTALLGDIAIAKSINEPLYNFAVVVDDYEMKISHVIRGEDHISNTPKQILIQEALGLPTPQYAHLPLILGPDRSKLSKRHGAVSINWYREQGYLPEAMVNFMALLGWSPQSAQGLPVRQAGLPTGQAGGQEAQNREIFSIKELIAEFSIEKIQKSGAIFNVEKLDWLNGQYIRKLNSDKLVNLCIPYLKQSGLIMAKIDKEYVKKIVSLQKDRLKKISDIVELSDFFFKDKLEYDKELLKWRSMSNEELKEILEKISEIFSKIPEKDFTKEKLEPILKEEAAKVGDNGKIFWPLRVALSGKKASPGPLEIAEILGKQKSAERIKSALTK